MIKELIADLAYDKIQLSQALTRSKIIASKIKNETFRKWLTSELEGYNYDAPSLPEYRKIRCEIKLRFSVGNGVHHDISVMIQPSQKEIHDTIQFHRVLEPIAIIEKNIAELSTLEGHIDLGPSMAAALFDLLASPNPILRRKLIGGYKEVGKAQFQNIVELTKQKLLDTLLELDNEFPDLVNEFDMTKDNLEKVQNIITNNIYGDNNPLNIAAGQNVEQKDIINSITHEDYSHLEHLGVDRPQIIELEQLIHANRNDKPNLKKDLAKWLGTVSAHVAAIGLANNIPAITEFIHKFI